MPVAHTGAAPKPILDEHVGAIQGNPRSCAKHLKASASNKPVHMVSSADLQDGNHEGDNLMTQVVSQDNTRI